MAMRRLDPIRHMRGRAVVLFLAAALGYVASAIALNPSFEQYKPSKRIAARLNRIVPKGVPFALCDYKEPSLVFYLDRVPVTFLHGKDVPKWLEEPGPGVLIITRRELALVEKASDGKVGLPVLATDAGLNYNANSRWYELVALARNLD